MINFNDYNIDSFIHALRDEHQDPKKDQYLSEFKSHLRLFRIATDEQLNQVVSLTDKTYTAEDESSEKLQLTMGLFHNLAVDILNRRKQAQEQEETSSVGSTQSSQKDILQKRT